jgi:hypothetical protein
LFVTKYFFELTIFMLLSIPHMCTLDIFLMGFERIWLRKSCLSAGGRITTANKIMGCGEKLALTGAILRSCRSSTFPPVVVLVCWSDEEW